ncbi:hypothetical protein KR215_010828 [Drosophila sulfurigaster]|nr:hypothetical protein KR215_010828 [Drosophila sulfurigaster]
MSSSKKRSKDEQIPKPISIKKEKSEEDRTLQPISHYIDDRLELVKQIFGTLKPKTIMNLAPEFLKKTSLDEIEELCLNELLCISTKRLKSIIADTRCPTDTESSEDSDVEHKEEHISLEEISSDSDIGGSETRRGKWGIHLKTIRPRIPLSTDGQISVLELLELQARARAIRSQLAMEPITKIEVKSDDEEEETSKRSSKKEKSREKRSHRSSEQSSSKRKSSEQSRREQAQTNGSKPKEITAPAPAPAQKKIKLKRNYRTSTKTPEKEVTPAVQATSQPEISQDKSDRSRSASPDVIPIPAEPETLLISDSTDDEATVKPKEPIEQTKVVPAPIPDPAPEPAELSEPEEGEVREESENETETEPVKKTAEEEQPIESTAVETEKPVEAAAAEAVPVESADVEKLSTSSQPIVEAEQPQLSSSIVDDEDQNDDVISIGGDLEHEMIAELAEVTDEPPVKVKPEKLPDPEEEDNDVISLNTSEDEHEKLQETNSESWRTRYLKSSKVNQVLAASRLGKRVRDKIKESKRAQKKHSEGKGNGDEKSSKQSQQQQFTSKHEDGSMEQYQELLQHRQRKSSNSSKGDK